MLLVNQLAGFGVGGSAFPPADGVNRIPTMTSGTTSGVTMAASSVLSGQEAWYAGDKVPQLGGTPGFHSDGSPTPHWLSVQFSAPQIIHSIRIDEVDSSYNSFQLQNFDVQTSEDGSSWTTHETINWGSWSSETFREQTFASPATATYWRLLDNASQSRIVCNELYLRS